MHILNDCHRIIRGQFKSTISLPVPRPVPGTLAQYHCLSPGLSGTSAQYHCLSLGLSPAHRRHIGALSLPVPRYIPGASPAHYHCLSPGMSQVMSPYFSRVVNVNNCPPTTDNVIITIIGTARENVSVVVKLYMICLFSYA